MSASNRVTEDFRRLAYRVERYLRLEATERLTVVTTFVVLIAVVMALATSAIFFLSTGTVKALTLLTGSEMVSYYIVGGVLLLLILLVFLLKKPLIENPFVRMFSEQLLNVPTVTEQMLGSKSNKDEQIRKLAESLVRELDEYEEEGGEGRDGNKNIPRSATFVTRRSMPSSR